MCSYDLSVFTADKMYSLSPAEKNHSLTVPYMIENVTVTASVYSNDNLLLINDNKVSVTDEVYGTGSSDILLLVGSNEIRVKLVAENPPQETEYQINVERAEAENIPEEEDDYNGEDDSSPSGNSGRDDFSPDVDEDIGEGNKVLLNTNNIVREKTKQGTKTYVKVDTEELKKAITNFHEKEVVKLEIKDTDFANVNLKGEALQNLANRNLELNIETSYGSFSFDPKAVDLQKISKLLGDDVSPTEVDLNIEINKIVDNSFRKTLAVGEEKGEYKVFVQPVEYKVMASYRDKTVEQKNFSAYVAKRFVLPKEYQRGQSVAGVIISSYGKLQPVPTKIEEVDGIYYAVVSTMTNSVYSIISLDKSFLDIGGHWGESDIRDLASRLIINGVNENRFEPDRDITRGEFVALMVKSLGLEISSFGGFSDITKDDWYYQDVSTAHTYGITNGYLDGSFRPLKPMSREEALVMVVNAIKLAKMETKIMPEEIEKELSRFEDSEYIADWAKWDLAYCIKNNIVVGYNNLVRSKNNITRAESAVLIKRMLELMNII